MCFVTFLIKEKFLCVFNLLKRLFLSSILIFSFLPVISIWDYQNWLILYLPFDDNTNDYSTYMNHGSGFNINPTTGKVWWAYTFDGINSYVSIPNNTHLNPTTGITLSAWVRWNINPTLGNTWSAIINKNADNQYRLQHNMWNTSFEFALRNPTNRTNDSTIQPISGTWYHVVGTYDTQNMYIYVNWVLEESLPTLWIINTWTVGINIGRRTSADHHFNGEIDEVAIWNRALSSGEITVLYNSWNGISLSDITPPFLIEINTVTTPTNNTTPSYTFSTNEAGSINYWWSCSSSTTNAIIWNNTITFNALAELTYNDCTITVIDSVGNVSNTLSINEFVVDTTPPVITRLGDPVVTLEVGTPYVDAWASAYYC